ncbi:MAG TPA: hypothetical protein VFX92_10870 [Candidatus Krumholzibacteria bacterium]|nr:hypothetical protein [Candidatus Krumholzibacteria bacterium]
MTKRFDEVDLSRLRPISIHDRRSKVHSEDIVTPAPPASGSGADLLAAFPDMLGAASLRRTVSALRRARAEKREIIWLMGAHVIKTGLSGYIGALMDAGYMTTVSTTGSAVIHDLELAFFGHTSEDVAVELPAGRFGMSRETSQHFNAALEHARAADTGLGAGVGDYITAKQAAHARTSLFARAAAAGIPATVHVAFGTDITHPHPGFPAETAGALTMRDFRIFAERVRRVFDGGVVVLVGSAVVLPEVFLKAVSVAYNLGEKPRDVFAVGLDMMPQYRVRENVLSRPFRGAGESHMITGHHEILLPLLYLLLRD